MRRLDALSATGAAPRPQDSFARRVSGDMGNVVDLKNRLAHRPRTRAAARPHRRPEFFFDLADPFTYLAAERVELIHGTVRWRPASASALARGGIGVLEARRIRREAEARARELGLPLLWPATFPAEAPAAMRAAAFACERGLGGPFVLAAGRLAFCGGFDLDDPEVLAEAAAVAGVGLTATLAAARDHARDAAIDATSRRLLAAGADRLPALRVRGELRCGEQWLGGAAPAASSQRPAL